MKIIAYQNPDYTTLLHSSSGGAFTRLAQSVLHQGGIVYGAAFNADWTVTHKRVDNEADLRLLQSSKYLFSDYLSSISLVMADMRNGKRVLFSGTPCQVAALQKRIGKNANLLLIEVACHGSPERKYWEKYLESICKKTHHQKEDIIEVNFRDKRNGWAAYNLTIKFKDGQEFSERATDNLYMRAFLKNYTLRKACFKCPFKYPSGSKADITLGDFWGNYKILPDVDGTSGISIVIFNTENGLKEIGHLRPNWKVDIEKAIVYNPAITECAKKPALYNEFSTEFQNSNRALKVFSKYVGDSLILKLKKYTQRLLHL